MKVSVVFGTRPEAIKMAPVVLALQQQPGLVCRVCVTGQHRQMLDQVLQAFSIAPDADLNLMQPNQTLAGLTARSIEAMDRYLAEDRPDLVLVQGDTTTAFCAAMASFYRKVPVGHVEAGLRTWNLEAPWPEEANRVLITRLAALHFPPTATARENLLRENVSPQAITVTGNTVVDALLLAVRQARACPPAVPGLPDGLQPGAKPGDSRARVVLITGHRRENFGEGFASVFHALNTLAKRFPEVHFVYPVHLNPNVREPVMRILGGGCGALRAQAPNIHLIEPLAYLPFVAMMDRATLILTDSGGVQEEAPSLGKPVLVMRETTERPEAVEAGTVRLVGTDGLRIVESVAQLLEDAELYRKMSRAHNPYGDGRAAERIAGVCCDYLRALNKRREGRRE